jgi:hypothetical protein
MKSLWKQIREYSYAFYRTPQNKLQIFNARRFCSIFDRVVVYAPLITCEFVCCYEARYECHAIIGATALFCFLIPYRYSTTSSSLWKQCLSMRVAESWHGESYLLLRNVFVKKKKEDATCHTAKFNLISSFKTFIFLLVIHYHKVPVCSPYRFFIWVWNLERTKTKGVWEHGAEDHIRT